MFDFNTMEVQVCQVSAFETKSFAEKKIVHENVPFDKKFHFFQFYNSDFLNP